MGTEASSNKDLKAERPGRTKLSAEESLKRLQEFAKRKEQFVADVRRQGAKCICLTFPTL